MRRQLQQPKTLIGRLKALVRRPPPVIDPLEKLLFRWESGDQFAVRDLLNGGILVLGRSGSGKTSSSGKWFSEAIVRYPLSSGLILCAKPEDKFMWQEIFRLSEREEDLLIFEPDGTLRLNFLDYVLQSGGDTRRITKTISSIGETLRSSGSSGRDEGDFWQREQERMIYNAVEIVKLSQGRVTAPDLHHFITTAATCQTDLGNPKWQAGFHCQCIHQAGRAAKSAIAAHDYELAEAYWLSEVPGMADRTKSSILVGVLGTLHVFNTGVVRELVSTETNVTPDDMLRDGKWVLVNMPPAQWGDGGNFVNAGWKYLTQTSVLRRDAEPGEFINVIWADEAQQFVNSFDAHYLAQCRSHLGCMVFLSQSLHSYYAALPGDAGRHQTDALLTNFHQKVFHALGDVETARFASNLVGRELQTFIGGSLPPPENLWETVMGRSQYTGSFSQHYEDIVQSNVFMNGLRTGGRANGYLCDAVVVRSGEPFSTGQNWMWTTFSQR